MARQPILTAQQELPFLVPVDQSADGTLIEEFF